MDHEVRHVQWLDGYPNVQCKAQLNKESCCCRLEEGHYLGMVIDLFECHRMLIKDQSDDFEVDRDCYVDGKAFDESRLTVCVFHLLCLKILCQSEMLS